MGGARDDEDVAMGLIPMAVLRGRYSDDENDGQSSAPQLRTEMATGSPSVGNDEEAGREEQGDEEDEKHNPDEEQSDGLEDSDDEEILTALDILDMKDDLQARGSSFGGNSFNSVFTSRRPNAHGGLFNKMEKARNEMRRTGGSSKSEVSRCTKNTYKLSHMALEQRLQGMLRIDDSDKFYGKGGNVLNGNHKKDKADRATVEQVLDPRTRMVLFKMINKGVFAEINGCVSTGKEANVYHAVCDDGKELAVKIFKTSILVYKDRSRFVEGDYRFDHRHKLSRSNPRKMVKLWAEKEMRNLARLFAAGIVCPAPVMLQMHILVMDFIGQEGLAAPRLKDAAISQNRAGILYRELCKVVRIIFQVCKLVHGDLSEYNILYYEGHAYIIDVSQSVEHDHPRALEFLREDCDHLNDFFRQKHKIPTLTVRELFDFVTDPAIGNTDEEIEEELERLLVKVKDRPLDYRSAENQIAEAVFKQTHIAQSTHEFANEEREQYRVNSGLEGVYYQKILGIQPVDESQAADDKMEDDMPQDESVPDSESTSDLSSSESDGQEEGEGPESESKDRIPKSCTLSREELKAARKENKKAVKEANRERRKTKLPKKEKDKRRKKVLKKRKG